MVSEQLQKWVESTRAKGYSNEQIKQHMLSQGYDAQLIEEALKPTDSSASSSDQALIDSISNEMKEENQPSASSSSAGSSYHPKKKLNIKAIIYLILIPLVGIGVYFFMTADSTVCESNLACDDGSGSTYDLCVSPGLETAMCVNAPRKELSSAIENSFSLSPKESVSFVLSGEDVVVMVDKIGATSVQVNILPSKQVLFLRSNVPKDIDVDKDGIVDMRLIVRQVLDTQATIQVELVN